MSLVEFVGTLEKYTSYPYSDLSSFKIGVARKSFLPVLKDLPEKNIMMISVFLTDTCMPLLCDISRPGSMNMTEATIYC